MCCQSNISLLRDSLTEIVDYYDILTVFTFGIIIEAAVLYMPFIFISPREV